MFHSPSPVMFIWYFAPIVFASSALRESAPGRSSLKSFLISTDMRFSSRGDESESRFSFGVKRRRSSGDDSISALIFRAVQALVGHKKQRLTARRRDDVGDRRDARGHRGLELLLLVRDLERLDGLTHALGEERDLLVLDAAHEDRELLAAVAREHVLHANRLLNRARD